MSLLTASFLKSLYPAFKDDDDVLVEANIAFAKTQVWEDKYKSSYEEAILALAAHKMQVDKDIASGDEFVGREITDYSVAGQSFSFKESLNDDDSDLKSTPYGRKFLGLKARSISMIPIIG